MRELKRPPLRVTKPRVALLVFVCLFALGLVELGWLPRTDWRSATGFDLLLSSPVMLANGDAESTGPRIEWLGHAGFLVRWGGVRILLDPNSSANCLVSRRRWDARGVADSLSKLGAIDVALISHSHFDHLDVPTLRRLSGLQRIVVPRGAAPYLSGLQPVIQEAEIQQPLDRSPVLTVGEIEIFAVPAAHNGNRWHPFESGQGALGYVLRRNGTSLYFAGDTGRGPHLREIGESFVIDQAILPIGAYSPRWPLAQYHFNPEDAVDAGLELGAGMVIPSHFGTFRLSADRVGSALPRFARAAAEKSVVWAMAPLLGLQ